MIPLSSGNRDLLSLAPTGGALGILSFCATLVVCNNGDPIHRDIILCNSCLTARVLLAVGKSTDFGVVKGIGSYSVYTRNRMFNWVSHTWSISVICFVLVR